MDLAVTFFTPQWLQNLVLIVFVAIFIAILIYVLTRKDLSQGEKFLLVIICFTLPVLGSINAIFYPRTSGAIGMVTRN